MLLWLTLFGPHPVPKISQQSSDNDLSHRILMQNLEQSFVVIGFRTYPGPSSDRHRRHDAHGIPRPGMDPKNR